MSIQKCQNNNLDLGIINAVLKEYGKHIGNLVIKI